MDTIPAIIAGISFLPPPYSSLGEIYPTYTQQRTSAAGIPYLSEFPTDIILLHIGTNGLDASNIVDNIDSVDQILDHVDSMDEKITVFLAKIINRRDQPPGPGLHQPTIDFNSQLESLALQRISKGDRIIVVDQESALNYPNRHV